MPRPRLPEAATVFGLKSTRDNRLRYIGQTTGLPQSTYRRLLDRTDAGKPGALLDWMRAEAAEGYGISLCILVEAGTLNETVWAVLQRAVDLGYELVAPPQFVRSARRRRAGLTMSAEARAKIADARKGKKHSVETRAKIGKALRLAHRRRQPAVLDAMAVPIVRGEGHHPQLAIVAALR